MSEKIPGDVDGVGSYSVKILSDDNNVASEVDLMIDIVYVDALDED